MVRQEADTLLSIAHQLTVLDQAWVVAAAFASHREGLIAWAEDKHRYGFIPRPDGVRLTKQSPMVIDMAVADVLPWGLTSGTVVMFLYILRHPQQLGSSWNDIRTGWHNSAAESEEAKRAAWLQRQINKELLGGSAPDPDLSDAERTSLILSRLADNVATLDAEVVEREQD